MFVVLVFAVFSGPELAYRPYEYLSECQYDVPVIIEKLRQMGAVAYSVTCAPLVKMEGV